MALRLPRLGQSLEVRYHKSSGSAPTPTDPYEQAAAQYGLSTGTAAFNAALNRPNTVNPVGSTSWNVTGYSGEPNSGPPAMATAGQGMGGMGALGGSGIPLAAGNTTSSSAPSSTPGQSPLAATSAANLTGTSQSTGSPVSAYQLGNTPINYTAGDPYKSLLNTQVGQGAPEYTQTTQLAPQFQSILQQPINTAGIPELSGENLGPQIDRTQNAVFNQNMGYLAPEEALQSEGLNSQLAAEGIMPGSAAWNNEQARLGRQQTFENTQAASGAVTAGEQELSNLYGLGGQRLQSEIAYQNQPINEFNALSGAPGATASAMTPDITGAFNQQYQGALAGYNANVATNNANTQAGAGLATAALLAFMLA